MAMILITFQQLVKKLNSILHRWELLVCEWDPRLSIADLAAWGDGIEYYPCFSGPLSFPSTSGNHMDEKFQPHFNRTSTVPGIFRRSLCG